MRRHGIVAAVSAELKTTVAELGESRVRVQVEVPPAEVQERLQGKARQLGRELKLPGFRRGKVPAPLVIQRVGREAVLDQAVALVRRGDRRRRARDSRRSAARPR